MIVRVILKCVYFSYIELLHKQQTKIYSCVAALSFWIISFVKKNMLFYKLSYNLSLRDEKKIYFFTLKHSLQPIWNNYLFILIGRNLILLIWSSPTVDLLQGDMKFQQDLWPGPVLHTLVEYLLGRWEQFFKICNISTVDFLFKVRLIFV